MITSRLYRRTTSFTTNKMSRNEGILFFGQFKKAVYLMAIVIKITEATSCNYTMWSEWSGHCPLNVCGVGTQKRVRSAAMDDYSSSCHNTSETKLCETDCSLLLVTKGFVVNEIAGNPMAEENGAPLTVDTLKYTYGSLAMCSDECYDIDGLDKYHETVCVMCTNENSCNRAGILRAKNTEKLQVMRHTRDGIRRVIENGPSCKCMFTPALPLMEGVCSVPSYYINFTVL